MSAPFPTAQDLKNTLQHYANPHDAIFLQRFFKTGPGQYGEGDVFIGVRVPITRRVCKQFRHLPLEEVQTLLNSPVHEHRLAAVIIMAERYKKANEATRCALYELYLTNTRQGRINNWDIIDVSAEHVVGRHLLQRPRTILARLAASPLIWERRLAIISTFAFIKQGDASTTLEMARLLLHDQHDLIRKAVGWMLREVGKRVDRQLLREFLQDHAHEMPRTMLRYAIEHFSAEERQHFMTL